MTGGQQVGERPEGHSVMQIAQSMRAEGAAEDHHRHRRARKIRRLARACPKASPSSTATRWTRAARVPRDQGHHGHHLRPDLRHRKAPPPQARHHGGPGQARGHQRAGVRRLRRLRRAVQLPERGAAGDRVRPQAHHQPEHLQQGHDSCVKGFCPSFVTVEGGQLKKKAKARPAVAVRAGRAARAGDPSRSAAGQAWGIVVAGVGGTGVITIGQLLGVAAHIEGKGIVTQDAGAWRKRAAPPGAMC
jgi:indolepyruvate ferredoxin oxidoreductase